MSRSTFLCSFPKYRATSRELVTGRPAAPRVTMGRSVTMPVAVTVAFNGHDVRVVMIDGAPWWVAADVCRVLSLQVTRSGAVNVTAACRHLDPAEGMLLSKQHCGARRGMFGISESGLYKLIMRSDKPEARAFQDWVTRVVLPAILRLRRSRSDKDGAYVMGEERVATGLRFQRPRNPHPPSRYAALTSTGTPGSWRPTSAWRWASTWRPEPLRTSRSCPQTSAEWFLGLP